MTHAYGSGTVDAELQAVANERKVESLESLLAQLNDLGFSRTDVARVTGTSVTAVRTQRPGRTARSENLEKAAMLVALCEIARSRFYLPDVASWLETPVHPATPITGLDLLAASPRCRSWSVATT